MPRNTWARRAFPWVLGCTAISGRGKAVSFRNADDLIHGTFGRWAAPPMDATGYFPGSGHSLKLLERMVGLD